MSRFIFGLVYFYKLGLAFGKSGAKIGANTCSYCNVNS